MLTQIIDLAPYERLRLLADENRKEHENRAKDADRQLGLLEQVEETYLQRLDGQIAQARECKSRARQRQIILAEWRIQAQQWQKLQYEHRQIEQTLATYEALLAQTRQIESDAQRYTDLKQALPSLHIIYEKRQNCANLQRDIALLEEQRAQQEQSYRRATEDSQQLQEAIEVSRRERDALQRKQDDILQQLEKLAPSIQHLASIENAQKQLQDLEAQLAVFEPDLPAQEQRLKQEHEQVMSVISTLPKLQQLVSARMQWHTHHLQLQDIVRTLQQSKEELTACNCAIEDLTRQDEDLRERAGRAQQEVTRVETILKGYLQRERNFQEIDGEATCLYCGQQLTPEHLEAERQKITEDLHYASEQYQQVNKHWQDLRNQRTQVQQQLEQEKQQSRDIAIQLGKTQEKQHDEALHKQRTETQVEGILQALPPLYIQNIQGHNGSLDLSACLQATYPTATDLAALKQEAGSRERVAKLLQEVSRKLESYKDLHTKIAYVANELARLEEICPSDQQSTIQQRHESLQQESHNVNEQLTELHQTISRQEQEHRCSSDILRNSEQELNRLDRQIADARQERQHATSVIEEKQAALPLDWQAQITDLSKEMLQMWQQEMQVLEDQGVEARRQELITARLHHEGHRQHLVAIAADSAAIPREAQRPVEELEGEIAQVDQEYQDAEREEQQARVERVRLGGILEKRVQELQRLQEARHLASLYKELAKLLGPDYLQRYLLQKAEKGIVFYANEFLDRISGGTLRLELAEVADQGTKALDLVAYNRSIDAGKPQPVRLLSGSQQFRVSVSLALGIGKYAARDNRRVESVIIDEGFGSLDLKGRQDMIGVIRDELKNVLRCIVVVSHQNEIFDEFENKFHVSLVEGSTQISLV